MSGRAAISSPLLGNLPNIRHGFAPSLAEAPPGIWRPRQVHRATLVRPGAFEADPSEADAVLALPGDPPVGVVTADCVPVLLALADGSAVAAVHAGWRGIAAGIVGHAVMELRRVAPAPVPAVFAAIGPAAGGCCYEVGPEVIAALDPAPGRLSPSPRPGHGFLDLRGVVHDRLAASGVAGECIEYAGPCSICSSAWPSYRRQGAAAGRLVAWIEVHARVS